MERDLAARNELNRDVGWKERTEDEEGEEVAAG